MYLTPAELMERFDAAELAQVAPPEHLAPVSAEVMRAVILDEDTGALDPEEVASAQAGLIRIEEAITDARQEVDGFLGSRYKLPLSPVPSLLKRLVASIARYHLHDDAATDEIRRRYEDSVKTLKAIAAGSMSLGLEEPSSTKTGSARIDSADTRWRRDKSHGYV